MSQSTLENLASAGSDFSYNQLSKLYGDVAFVQSQSEGEQLKLQDTQQKQQTTLVEDMKTEMVKMGKIEDILKTVQTVTMITGVATLIAAAPLALFSAGFTLGLDVAVEGTVTVVSQVVTAVTSAATAGLMGYQAVAKIQSGQAQANVVGLKGDSNAVDQDQQNSGATLKVVDDAKTTLSSALADTLANEQKAETAYYNKNR